jgi:hypothetical protein
MLTCAAIALNMGPFAKTAKIELSAEKTHAIDARTAIAASVSNPIAPREFEASASSGGSQPVIDLAGDTRAVSLAALPQPVSLAAESMPQSPSPSRVEADPAVVSEAQVAPAVSQPSPTEAEADVKAAPAVAEVAPVEVAAAPQSDDANSDLVQNATIIGVWAPNAGTCSAREFREGALPAIISAEGAWAGDTFCLFSSKKQTETGWNVVAKCSNPREHWRANVRLTVKDNRLTWMSRRGTQAYTRCAADVLMAEAR